MKAVFVDNSLWSLLHFRGSVIKAIRNKGYQVTLVAPYEKISDDLRISDVDYRFLSMNRTSTSLSKEIVNLKEIYHILKKEKPCIVFTYTLKPTLYIGIISFLKGKYRIVSMLAGLGQFINGNGFKYSIVKCVSKVIFKQLNKVVLLNEEDKNSLCPAYLDSNKVLVLKGGEGLDLNKYRPKCISYKNGIKKILMIGRILYSKGYSEFVECARAIRQLYPEVSFSIAGYIDEFHPDGVRKDRIVSDVENGYINYLGTTDDVTRLLEEYDLFVLPSFYNEGMNRSLMEAIAMGKVVISTDNKGCREMVKDGINGFLIKPRSATSLTNAVKKAINLNESELNEMGNQSRRLAEQYFSDEQVISSYMQIACEMDDTGRI